MLLWFKSQMLLSKKKKDSEELESMTEAQDIVSQTNAAATAAVSEEVTSSHCWKLQSTSSVVQETSVGKCFPVMKIFPECYGKFLTSILF